ncbi:uncharacterized protein LOC129952692 isoform X2 [Eupeodes corollae]|uniref:uncharacterized protein LOC129952692 isoform X2 n=1 Tax=Eupeodes corollae TaxID=290404 RepID=UPI00248F5306|nr:uncharacterized protein LOC129952692 isoform X2 [Eupeodes corollae]
MSKTIKKDQSDMLLSKMQENPETAKGFTKANREKVAQFWKRLILELNSAGPPVKSEFEWKKASANKVHQKGTGGGPNKTQKFSPSEEAIFQLVGMKEAVEGVPLVWLAHKMIYKVPNNASSCTTQPTI